MPPSNDPKVVELVRSVLRRADAEARHNFETKWLNGQAWNVGAEPRRPGETNDELKVRICERLNGQWRAVWESINSPGEPPEPLRHGAICHLPPMSDEEVELRVRQALEAIDADPRLLDAFELVNQGDG